MPKFSKDEIKKIGEVLDASKVTEEKEYFRLLLKGEGAASSFSLNIYPRELLGRERGALIVVYTGGAHLQLHNCSGYVISEELGEVTFVSETSERLSGLVIERGGFCSQYASIDRSLISSDFTKLGVEVMLSGVALSLAEGIISKDNDN